MKRLSLNVLSIGAILLLTTSFFISNSFSAPETSGNSGLVRISGLSPYTPGCNEDDEDIGIAYVNSETEPHIAVNPTDGDNMIAAWHQDRWSSASAASRLASIAGLQETTGLAWAPREERAHFSCLEDVHVVVPP